MSLRNARDVLEAELASTKAELEARLTARFDDLHEISRLENELAAVNSSREALRNELDGSLEALDLHKDAVKSLTKKIDIVEDLLSVKTQIHNDLMLEHSLLLENHASLKASLEKPLEKKLPRNEEYSETRKTDQKFVSTVAPESSLTKSILENPMESSLMLTNTSNVDRKSVV